MDASANRLRLTYILEDSDISREIELPFIVGILANLSGNRTADTPPLGDREFEEVRRPGLDRFLRTTHPRLTFEVPDILTKRSHLSVDLSFECFEDFTPASVAMRVEPLRRLMELRGGLSAGLTTQLDLIVQHESFRELEAAWRGLAYLLDHARPHPLVRVVALDCAKRELQKSLQRYRGTASHLSPIFRKVYEERYQTHGGEPFGCLIGDYYFNHTDADCLVLEEMAKLGAAAHCPFATALSPSLMHLRAWDQLAPRQNVTGIFRAPEYARWRSLREAINSRFLVLTLPQILSEHAPVERLTRDVDGPQAGAGSGDRWINPAFAVGVAFAESFGVRGSWRGLAGTLRRVTQDVGLEASFAPDRKRELASCGFLALSPEAPEGVEVGLPTVASPTSASESIDGAPSSILQHVLLFSRFAQHIHAIIRDKADSFVESDDCRIWLQKWLMEYVDGAPQWSSETTKLVHPLTLAEIQVEPDQRRPGSFRSTMWLRFHDSPESPTPFRTKRTPRVRTGYAVGLAEEHVQLEHVLDAFQLHTPAARETVAQGLHHFAVRALEAGVDPSREPSDVIEEMIHGIDQSLNKQLNLVFHHPDFQQLERTWRGLSHLVRPTTTERSVKIRALNIAKGELREILKGDQRGDNRRHLAPQVLDRELHAIRFAEPFGCLVGDYYFDHSPEDVELLERVGEVCARLHCPFVGGVAPSLMQMENWLELPNPRDYRKIFATPEYAAWRALRESEASRYLALAMPRFLGRCPFGKEDDLDQFWFVEDAHRHEDFSWLNAAYAVGLVINRAFEADQWPARICGVETGGTIDGLVSSIEPVDGWIPRVVGPTEVTISDPRARQLAECGLVPLVCRRHSTSATFFRVNSLHKPPQFDDTASAAQDAGGWVELSCLLAACRFAQYMTVICRDSTGAAWLQDRDQLEEYLQRWIMNYVDGDPEWSMQATKAQKPLASASIRLDRSGDRKDLYAATLQLQPHYQLPGLTQPVTLVMELRTSPELE